MSAPDAEDTTLAPVEVPWGTTWPALDEFRDRRVPPTVETEHSIRAS